MDRRRIHTGSMQPRPPFKRRPNTPPPSVNPMRSAVLQLPDARTANERRQVLRAAIRQLERADIYLAAVGYMAIDDRDGEHALNRLRADLESLRRYLADRRSDTAS